jgi:hypothetical protein
MGEDSGWISLSGTGLVIIMLVPAGVERKGTHLFSPLINQQTLFITPRLQPD